MAERRMFAKTIIDSDAFLDMSLSTQALYFHLSMRADDDGFINNPKKIQRMIGASEDDMKVLIIKRFIIPFESGIVVIKHWKIHNYIRGDRKKDTNYPEEMSLLAEKENGAYTLKTDDNLLTDTCLSSDGQVTDKCQHRLGKVSLGKDSLVEGRGMATTTTASEPVGNVDNSEDDVLKAIGGIGRGVVYLSDNQFEALMDKIGLEAFDLYVAKLANYIIDKNANIKNHYKTILKWVAEDSEI